MNADSACVFNSTGQQYRRITSFAYSGGAVIKIPNLSAEIYRQIRAGWMSLGRYTRELCDRLKSSLLYPKAWMVEYEVVEALLSCTDARRGALLRATAVQQTPYCT